MSAKDCVAILFAGLAIASIIFAFGLASDWAGHDETQRQFDCIDKGGSYVAIKDDDDYIQGYECILPGAGIDKR